MVGSDGESDDALHSIAKLGCAGRDTDVVSPRGKRFRCAAGPWLPFARYVGMAVCLARLAAGSVVGGCRSSPIGGTILFRPVQLGGEVEAINLAHRCFGDINQLVISNGLYSGPQENLTLSTPPSHL
jgi:hypothetical protein